MFYSPLLPFSVFYQYCLLLSISAVAAYSLYLLYLHSELNSPPPPFHFSLFQAATRAMACRMPAFPAPLPGVFRCDGASDSFPLEPSTCWVMLLHLLLLLFCVCVGEKEAERSLCEKLPHSLSELPLIEKSLTKHTFCLLYGCVVKAPFFCGVKGCLDEHPGCRGVAFPEGSLTCVWACGILLCKLIRKNLTYKEIVKVVHKNIIHL